MTLPDDEYFFAVNDLRYEFAEPGDSFTVWPFVQLFDSQQLHWWNGEPVAPTKPVDFHALEGTPQDPELYERMQAVPTPGGLLVKTALGRFLRQFAPDHAQFIPSYIKTTRGEFDFEEDWEFLHLWKMQDLVDPEKSERLVLRSGKVRPRYDTIVLDESKMAALPESDRLMIRVKSLDTDELLFHRDVVRATLERGFEGGLFVPLSLYRSSPALNFDTLDIINGINGVPT